MNEENPYIRVGTSYYKIIQKPTISGDTISLMSKWNRETIITDHGKDFISNIPKLDDFICIPDNLNYERIIGNFYNTYNELPFKPVEEKVDIDSPKIEKSILFLKHIFGNQFLLGIDYLKILLELPTQYLPILCLVSKERATGKTTMIKWLKAIFGLNMTYIKGDSFSSQFNADWTAKLIVAIDEVFFDRKEITERLKYLSTTDAQLNTKDVFWILSKNDVDLNLNNPKNPTFLCLGNDSTLPQVYAPVISLIISVGMRQMNKPQQQKSVVLLDEAPTIYIPNIEQIPATARSNKIATIFGVQDFSQLVDNYGQDKAQIIISNLGNQFFGRVTNGKTAEMVKTLFSKEDRTFINKNTGTGTSGTVIHIQSNDSKSKSENIQERDRVKVSDLINLNPGEFYGIIAEGEPKEFLKTQFLEDFASDSPTSKEFVSDKEMSENYFRIIEESKNLI